MKVILYSPQLSPRLSYIADFFSKHISGEAIIISNSINEFIQADAIKINYSQSPVAQQELWIQPHTLLFDYGIDIQEIECFVWNHQKVFFKTGGDIPFDIFAASFYLLSRYEEYLPHEKDFYGLYAHVQSIAFKEGFLDLPLINLWIQELQKILLQKFTYHIKPGVAFTFLPTYDIDIAYAYLHKPLLQNITGLCKAIFNSNKKQFLEIVNVLKKKNKDPFDTYDWLNELHEKYNLKPCYFFLLAEKRKGYDKNISPSTNAMQLLIEKHAAKYITGLHPSWQSGENANVLKKEIGLLTNITAKPVTKSRQHYIRMHLPETYRLLIKNGITEDYSMGYGSINGFRASACCSFYWYDLEREEKTALLLRPFCYMEANSFFEQKYTAAQAAVELQQYHDIIKSVNGELITIFHNHFLTEQKEWLPWRNMYADFLKKNFS